MKIGTPFTPQATKVLMLGGGELGKEVVIELQRLGVETIVCDRYENSPAMQVAHRSYVFDMLDGEKIRHYLDLEKPDIIVPEIEAIDTNALENYKRNLVPSYKAVSLTMNREGIRERSTQLGLKTSAYRFADSREEMAAAVEAVGYPCVVKPIMSSSGKGQSVVHTAQDIDHAWNYSQAGGRVADCKIIVEGFVNFDYELTLLTVRHRDGVSFCDPIRHLQIDGDYRYSWQPAECQASVLAQCRQVAETIVRDLTDDTDDGICYGIFGVELFVEGDQVYFSEISPRPHDTGLVTLVSQDQSEFALHAKAILGLPIPDIRTVSPAASAALVLASDSEEPFTYDISDILAAGCEVRLFGKPSIIGQRRMGVVLKASQDPIHALIDATIGAQKLKQFQSDIS